MTQVRYTHACAACSLCLTSAEARESPPCPYCGSRKKPAMLDKPRVVQIESVTEDRPH